jgi:hypothetical protein
LRLVGVKDFRVEGVLQIPEIEAVVVQLREGREDCLSVTTVLQDETLLRS